MIMMNGLKNNNLTQYAKKLRREMTKEERHLWYDFLRDFPSMVHRQKVIGHYIVDFYIASAKTIIELDGGQHYEEAGLRRDEMRDTYFKENGIRVLRYSNIEVMRNFSGVCEDILRKTETGKQ